MKSRFLKLLSLVLLGGVLGVPALNGVLSNIRETKAVDSTTYSTVFLATGSSDSGNAYGSTNGPKSIDEIVVSNDIFGSVTVNSKLYVGKAGTGIKIGSGSSNGYVTFTLNDSCKSAITLIEVETAVVNSKDASNVIFSLDSNTIGTVETGSKFTYAPKEAQSASTFKIETDVLRAYIKNITFTIGGEIKPIEGGEGTETGEDLDDKPEPTGDVYFTQVTSISELTSGAKVLMAHKTDDEVFVNAPFGESSKFLPAVQASLLSNKIQVDSISAGMITIGVSSSSYVFEIDSKYVGRNGSDLAISKTAVNWNITFDNGIAKISDPSNANNLIYFNASSNPKRFKTYTSSTMGQICLYKLDGDAPRVILESDEVSGTIVEGQSNTVQLKVKEVKGVESVISYAWSIVGDSDIISLASGQDTNTLTVNLLKRGTAQVKVVVNGTIEATATINISEWVYDVLEGNRYFISNKDGKGVMGGDISNKTTIDFESETDVWTFEKAYKGDNTYWIKNGLNYLNYKKDALGSGSNSAIVLTPNKVNYWAVVKVGDYFNISTQTSSMGKRSLSQDSDLDWLVFEDNANSNLVSLINGGSLVYSTFEIVKGPGLTYPYVGDIFVDNNVKINAIFTNGYKKDITSEITWGTINSNGTVQGTYIFDGDDKVITLTDINVYSPIADSFIVTGIKEKYSVGESVNVTSVKLTYARSNGTTTERTLTASQYTVSPKFIDSEEIDKVTVIFNSISSIKKEFNIEVKPIDFVPASKLSPGDEIILTASSGIHQYESKLETNGTNYNRLLGVQYEYAPKGESVFALESAGAANKFYLKDKNSGNYLNGQVDGVVTSDKIETMESLDGKFKSGEFQFKPSDSDNVITITNENTYSALLSYNESLESWNSIVYTDSSYMDYYELEMIVVEEKALLSVTHVNFTLGTEFKCDDIEYRVCNYSPLILVNPYKSGTTKDAFTFMYNENLDQGIHWWTISCGDEYVGVSETTDGVKFTLSNTESFDIDVYRNKNIEPSIKVKSLKATADESLLTVKKGDTFNWNNVTVIATYEDNSHAMVDYGAYIVSGLDTSTIGKQTVTITYQGVSTTIQIYVLSANPFQPKIDGNLKEIYVGDTQYSLKTTQNAPDGEPVTWSSSNENVATIDQNGHIVALSAGKVIFTVTSFDGYSSDSKEITVSQRVTGLSLENTEKTIEVGETFNLIPIVTPNNAKNKRVIFSTEDVEIVSVVQKNSSTDTTSYAEITGLKEGSAVIKAQTEGKGTGEDSPYVAYCIVTVEAGGTPVIEVESISFAETTLEVDVNAEDFKLNPIITPSNATVKDCTFVSSNPEIASVSNSGWVNPKAVGTTVITATTVQGGKTAAITIKVKKNVEPVVPTNIVLCETSLNLNLEENTSAHLTAIVTPDNATYSLTWSSSNADVATVDDKGNVLAVGKGTCTITVSTQNGKTATCIVTVTSSEPTPVVNVDSVTLDVEEKSLNINESFVLHAVINPEDATNKNVTWSSSDETVATVDGNGKVTAVGKGTAEITVKTIDGELTDKCTVVVIEQIVPVDPDEPADKNIGGGVAIIAGIAAIPAIGVGLGVGIPVSIHKKHKKLLK